MNKYILNTDSQEFINSNLNADISTLLLKGTSFEHIETKELIEQIESKKKSQKKLPTWFNQSDIYYPNKLNIEQTSSEITAEYKASLLEGKTIVDLTGGFGVDCLYFSKRFEKVIHCEINEELSRIVQHNFKQLQVDNIETILTDGIKFIKQSTNKYDWIFVDPSRRHDIKGKVFFLNDCLPNIPLELDSLFEHSNNIMIKTSPLLDVSAGINELKYVKTIHVIAVNNDVKELLWILENKFDSEIEIKTINFKSETQEHFQFMLSDESEIESNFSLPLTYLYEPNSAILKSGGFNSVSDQMKVTKLHKHSHLYTNDILTDFPGRRFKIDKQLAYNKKLVKSLNLSKANITTRNFLETVQQLRSTFKIKDGGDIYLFFTTNMLNEKIVLICSKAE